MPGTSFFDNGTTAAGWLNAAYQKEGYDELYKKDHALYQEFEAKGVEPGGGSSVKGRVVLRPPNNVGFRGLFTRLPSERYTIGAATVGREDLTPVEWEHFPTYGYAGFEFAGPLMQAIATNPSSPGGALRDLMAPKLLASTDRLRELSQIGMTARNQALAVLSADPGTTDTLTCTIVAGTAATYDAVGTMNLRVGQRINICDPATGTVRGAIGHRVTAILSATQVQITPVADASVAVGDILVEGDTNSNSHGRMPDSLWAGAGTAANRLMYGGISRSLYPEWEGFVSSGAGTIREFSTPIFHQHVHAHMMRLGFGNPKSKPDLIIMRPGMTNEPWYGLRLGNTPAGVARTQVGFIEDQQVKPTLMEAGLGAFTFTDQQLGTLRLKYFDGAPPGTVFVLRKDTWHIRRWGGPTVLPGGDASGLTRQAGFDVYDMYLRLMEAFYTDNPRANSIITELAQNIDWAAR